MSIWFLLPPVDWEIAVCRRGNLGVLFERVAHDEDIDFKSTDRAKWDDLEAVFVPIASGDALCFT